MECETRAPANPDTLRSILLRGWGGVAGGNLGRGAPHERTRGKMQKFIVGLVIGLLLGSSMAAFAAGIFGSGVLTGWSVTKDGEEVCSDPSVDEAGKEIECD